MLYANPHQTWVPVESKELIKCKCFLEIYLNFTLDILAVFVKNWSLKCCCLIFVDNFETNV